MGFDFFDSSVLRAALKTDEIILELDETVEENSERRLSPSYHFKICRISDEKEVGYCDFRVGHTEKLYFGGNIGYRIYPPFRGNRYAAKACLLLFEMAKLHEMKYIYITCNPDNIASRRTCEIAGGVLESVINLPTDNDMFLEGERQKCMYKFDFD